MQIGEIDTNLLLILWIISLLEGLFFRQTIACRIMTVADDFQDLWIKTRWMNCFTHVDHSRVTCNVYFFVEDKEYLLP